MAAVSSRQNEASGEAARKPSMVLVMGVTGSGKSRFINSLVRGAVEEYSGLHSGTQHCQIVQAKIGEELEVAIVDTPGLDDSKRSDAEILRHITSFLTTQYQLGIPLKGIIYLHRITDNKMQGSALKQFRMFQEIVGDAALENVILGTTMWDRLPSLGEGFERDMELRKNFWSLMEQKGSQIVSVDGSKGKAEGMIRRLMMKKDVVLQIQKEMFEEHKLLGETSAAKVLAPSAGERESYKRLLQMEMEKAKQQRDSEVLSRLRKERQEYEERQRKEDEDFAKLKAARVAEETQAKIDEEKSGKGKWKDVLSVFASVAGLTINIVLNLLPVLGVGL